MRAYRKRPWAALVVDLTPLIDVIFLIIIFFIILINFSEVHIRNVVLPNADQAYTSNDTNKQKMVITIKSREEMFLDRDTVTLSSMVADIGKSHPQSSDVTALLRADQDVPYELIKLVMLKLATANIDKVQFATWEGPLVPLDSPVESAAPAMVAVGASE